MFMPLRTEASHHPFMDPPDRLPKAFLIWPTTFPIWPKAFPIRPKAHQIIYDIASPAVA
jgi:hypothetical protein